MLAEDSLSIPQIAQQLGTHESTVDRWKKVPEFQARLKENIGAFRTKFLECGLLPTPLLAVDRVESGGHLLAKNNNVDDRYRKASNWSVRSGY